MSPYCSFAPIGPKKISPIDPKVLMAKNMHKDHGMGIHDICKTLKISRASFYRYITLQNDHRYYMDECSDK